MVKEVYLFDTVYAENNGDGTFAIHPLPLPVQFAPVYAILAEDVDRDGHKDLILAGNFDGVPPRRGRYDASYGWFLRGDGQGGFAVIEPAASTLWITGQARALRRLRQADGARLILVARNDAPVQVFR
jgi:hypothetical protein